MIVCPVEIEKLVDVIDILDREDAKVDILPIFISVDPERDTIERVRRYCAEFSPKLRGYTGTKEQVCFLNINRLIHNLVFWDVLLQK